jgi:hypothetical protein
MRKADPSEVWSVGISTDEALTLYHLVDRNQATVEDVRELIEVGAENEAVLMRFAKAFPQYRSGVLKSILFRRNVLESFNSLVDEIERDGRDALRRWELRTRGGKEHFRDD